MAKQWVKQLEKDITRCRRENIGRIYKLLHYKKSLSPDLEYATVSEREYPKPNYYKYYTKNNLPNKYKDVIKRPCDKCVNNIEKWYL